MATPRPHSCPACATAVRPTDHFCFYCGAPLPAAGAVVQPPAPVPSPARSEGPTDEQWAAIRHPVGQHARVMAVAGSGKTTTMVHRIAHLIQEHRVNPKRILVLMYNAEARRDFKQKLAESSLAPQAVPSGVHTFHSYAYMRIHQIMQDGLLPRHTFWMDEEQEKGRLTLLRALRNLRLQDEVNSDEAAQAISLWKGSLIPPERAGYRGHPRMPEVYREYERLRTQDRGLSYDDFVPTVVDLLETAAPISSRWTNQADFVIVDEYQDVNYGQQRLLELLAGQRADVMVVGDDDQTIYEWRGARPSYIIREFQQIFDNKPHVDYRLSHSFRFGPLIAQSAQNVISFNTNRVPKRLVAHQMAVPSEIVIVTDQANHAADVDEQLADQIELMLNHEDVPAKDMVVLARMFVQLSGIETQLLDRKIPYHVHGARPFFDRREVRSLLDYVRVALSLDEIIAPEHVQRLLGIANTPGRMLNRATIERACQQGLGQATTLDILEYLADPAESLFSNWQRERVDDLRLVLARVGERIAQQPDRAGGDLLEWIARTVSFETHFDDYYGQGEASADRKLAVASLIAFAKRTGLGPIPLLDHIARQDPTQGQPLERQVRLTTIFKTKGLEYEYVFLPHCEEGFLPCLYGHDVAVFDTAGVVKEPEPSESIENERRLFYVGVTRARQAAFIGTSVRPAMGYLQKDAKPSRFLEELQLGSIVGVLAPMQRLARGERQAYPDVLSGVRKWAGQRWVKQSLVDNYLASLGDSRLTGEIATILGAATEEPFSYRRTYEGTRPPQRGGRPADLLPPALRNLPVPAPAPVPRAPVAPPAGTPTAETQLEV